MRKLSFLQILIFSLVFFLLAKAKAAITPDRVLVLANTRSQTSREMASFYLRVRHIPGGNLCLLPLPVKEEITRPVYLKKIERPLAKFLIKHHLEDQILAIVIMPGIPHKISGRVARDGDAASVDSELTLLYRKMIYGPYRLAGWIRNPFFATPEEITFEHDRFDIYLVTRIAAYTPKEAKDLIKRALLAEKTKPPYAIVLDAKDGPIRPGDNWIYAAYLRLKDRPGLCLITSFDPAFITSGERVIGYCSWGSNDPNYPPDRRLYFRFLPGAIGVTYVSTSARTFKEPPLGWEVGPWKEHWRFFAGSPQSLIADLIRLGITGISGNVYEPYLGASARPYILFPAYLQGDTLAEAYYRSLAFLSWQTVVIGDPLTRLGRPVPSQGPKSKNWFERRKEVYQEALKRRTEEDRLFLAKIYLRQGLTIKAFEELKPLLKKKEIKDKVFGLLFQIAQDKASKRRVVYYLRQSQDPRAQLVLAFLALREKQWILLKDYLRTLQKEPNLKRSFEVRYLKAMLEVETGHCQEAIPLFEGLIAQNPGRFDLYLPFIKALKACGQAERAARIKERILAHPELVELWPELTR